MPRRAKSSPAGRRSSTRLSRSPGRLVASTSSMVRSPAPSRPRSVAASRFLWRPALSARSSRCPSTLYRTFGLEQRFGFNRTNPRQFVLDRLKRGAIALVVAVPLLFGLLFVMRTLTGLWWLWAWVGVVAIMMLAPTVYVRFIAPRFNRFEPLADGELRARIEAVLARSRLSLVGPFHDGCLAPHGAWQCLLHRLRPDQTDRPFRYAHRALHAGGDRGSCCARTRPFPAPCTFCSACCARAAMLFVVFAAFGWLTKQPWLLPAFGVGYQDDALAFFVCLLLASIIGPLSAPIGNWISRRERVSSRRLRPPHGRRRADGERADPARA